MRNISKCEEWDRNDFLQIVLYHDYIQRDKDGWFSVEQVQ
jgi:hypothetical protein